VYTSAHSETSISKFPLGLQIPMRVRHFGGTVLKRCLACAILWACTLGGALHAQTQAPAKVDFKTDVQPIFRANCYGCHGSKTQKNNFRLDRRKDAMRGGTIPVIGPGNSAASRLYLRLIGTDYGLQMPPTGPLKAEQVNIIKAWIDQGAEWPDDASGEMPLPPPDPEAARLMEAIRNGNRRAFDKMLKDDHAHVKLKGPGGSTPLMYAALYGDADCVRRLLADGADPNIKNESGSTALMWATDDLEKTQLLIEHGADVNAVSDFGRTPLLIAAGRSGSSPVVKLLLDHGANPNAHSVSLFGVMTPLAEAAFVGDDGVVKMLLDRGADLKAAGINPLSLAILARCSKAVDLLMVSADQDNLNQQAVFNAPPLGDALALKLLFDHGADVKGKTFDGSPLLLAAAASDMLPVDAVKTMIERGADVNAKNPQGQTALDLAKGRGQTPVVDLLVQAGAKEGVAASDPALKPSPASSARAAIQRSIPLLQRTDVSFSQKTGCISCHNDTFTAVTVSAVRKRGMPVDEEIAKKQLETIGAYIESWREKVLQGIGIPGDTDTIGYILVGLAAENYPPDPATDALARFVKDHQTSNGNWFVEAHRPPLESSDIEATAISMRAMQAYAPKMQRAEYDTSIKLAAAWLKNAQPKTTEDKALRLMGLAWAKAGREAIRSAAKSLLADQRADGGWAQIPTLSSDAYATGQALTALRESGAVSAKDSACQRASAFLLSTQFEDGSWHVKTRALPIQPYFESGFPYGHDQFISAAGTNWATKALALEAR
jgi:ankyrin repeat protein